MLKRKRKGQHSEVVMFERDQFEALLRSIRLYSEMILKQVKKIEDYIGGLNEQRNVNPRRGSKQSKT